MVSQQIKEYNAKMRAEAGKSYLVVELATGKAVGDGKPMPRMFADHVLSIRNWPNRPPLYALQEV